MRDPRGVPTASAATPGHPAPFPRLAWLGVVERRATTRTGLAILALALAIHAGVLASRRMSDFAIYREAAIRTLAGESPYRLEDPHRYLYAPAVTAFFVPAALLPELVAKLVFYAINLLVLFDLLRRLERRAFAGGRAPPGFTLLLLLLVGRFVDNNLGHGQVNLIVVWAIVLAYDLADARRFAVAGLALALAVATKVFPFVLLLHLALRERWRFFIATVVAGGLLFAVPLLWWGDGAPALLADWQAVLADQTQQYDVANKANQSIAAFCQRTLALGAEASVLATFVVNALFIGLIAVTLRRTRDDPGRGSSEDLALVLLYATVIMPISWKYYYATTIPAATFVLARWWNGERAAALGVVVPFVALANLLPGLGLLGKETALALQNLSLHFLGVVALALTLAVLAFRERAVTEVSVAD